ncbi:MULTISPECIES: hypothetical protein [Micromonospora]|uniref:hypothetical protein n=1 Tax=Micromonospora TaxID=1873 RepID=UPI001E4D75B8|nr:hypothetical protein [Micromonospora sp. NBRC 110038]
MIHHAAEVVAPSPAKLPKSGMNESGGMREIDPMKKLRSAHKAGAETPMPAIVSKERVVLLKDAERGGIRIAKPMLEYAPM